MAKARITGWESEEFLISMKKMGITKGSSQFLVHSNSSINSSYLKIAGGR